MLSINKQTSRILVLILSLMLLSTCGAPKQKRHYRSHPQAKPLIKKQFKGMASWYGGKFHGRKTASGEKFNKNKLTAAHRNLPFGTKIKVTNLSNGKKVVLRINDRGPFIKSRVLDVSRKAAKELGFLNQGKTKVHVLILKKE
jgi:rare lipoprotein A